MAKKPSTAKAGNFRPWDGKLTGPQSGDPAPMPGRNQTWGSVQKKQIPRTFTVEEVKEIVAEAIAAMRSGKELPIIDETIQPVTPEVEEEFVIGGK